MYTEKLRENCFVSDDFYYLSKFVCKLKLNYNIFFESLLLYILLYYCSITDKI